MANNTVEATLRSKFEDGISRGVKQTQNVLDGTFRAMASSGAVLGSGMQRVFDGMLGHLQQWRERLSRTANESDSHFRRISMGSAAMALAVAVGVAGALRALGGFLLELTKEASAVTELKVTFEGLVGSAAQAETMLGRLREATEGLVAPTDLLRNANRVLQSGIPITNEQYVRLASNVTALAKAAGTDLNQALTATTDALIRGNARGFQAIGIHVNVKNAVSELAEQMGMGANVLADHTKLQGFYNELLAQTDAAVRRLPPGMISMEDAVERAERAWRDYLLTFGEAINRSGVVQEVLRLVTERLGAMSASGKDVENLALVINRFIISVVRGFASTMEVLSIFSVMWDTAWGTVKVVVYSAGSMIASALFLIQKGLVSLFEMGAKLPGTVGRQFEAMVPSMKAAADMFGRAVQTYTAGAVGAFDGYGEGAKKAQEMAAGARQLAANLEKYAGVVVSGARGTKAQGDAAAGTAVNQKQLNDQLKAYYALLQQIEGRTADARQKAVMQLAADFRQIDELTQLSEDQRQAGKRQALLSYLEIIRQINEKELDETREHQLALDQMGMDSLNRRGKQMLAFLELLYLAPLRAQAKAEQEARERAEQAASGIDAMTAAIEMARQGRIGGSVGADAARQRAEMERTMQARLAELNARPNRSAEDVNEIVRLTTALENLRRADLSPTQRQLADLHAQFRRFNELKMDGFHGIVQTMKDHLLDFVQQGAQAFVSFFADLASGQENAGKKLLAAFIGMVGQMLATQGVYLMTLGIAEVIAASTLFGRLAGANAAAGAAAIAKGAAMAAMGGIMMGAASTMAQTNAAGAGGSFQENVPRPTSANQVQVIEVGAAGRAQTPGQVGQAPLYGELHVTVEPPKGWVVNEIKNEYKHNNRTLRTVIQNA
ncbi:MAG: hypothetical protein ACM3ZB_07105 [bacterium]